MQIAVIGHGRVGGALAKSWSYHGHRVLIGARNPEDEKVRALSALNHIEGRTIPESVRQAEVLLIATPPQAAPGLASQMGKLEGKVLIDATNTIGPSASDTYPTAFHAFRNLTKAEVVKCFNTTGFENMIDPVYGSQAIDMFMAGDDVQAKATVRQLALDAGFSECYDFGGSDKVILLEQLAMSWINLAIFQKQGRNIAFKILKR